MVIQVVDDGAGLDRKRIAEKAVATGLAAETARLSDEDLARIVFEPGFSTADRITEISGRGVGMDVVRRNVEALRGSVAIESERGRGTAVTIRVPLTLSIIQGFKVGIGDEAYILPLDAVVECLELPASETRGGRRLRRRQPARQAAAVPAPAGALRARGRAARAGERRRGAARHADRGRRRGRAPRRELDSIKPLGTMFKGIPGVAGSSILGNGRVALILDVSGLLRETLRRAAAREAAAA